MNTIFKEYDELKKDSKFQETKKKVCDMHANLEKLKRRISALSRVISDHHPDDEGVSSPLLGDLSAFRDSRGSKRKSRNGAGEDSNDNDSNDDDYLVGCGVQFKKSIKNNSTTPNSCDTEND